MVLWGTHLIDVVEMESGNRGPWWGPGWSADSLPPSRRAAFLESCAAGFTNRPVQRLQSKPCLEHAGEDLLPTATTYDDRERLRGHRQLPASGCRSSPDPRGG